MSMSFSKMALTYTGQDHECFNTLTRFKTVLGVTSELGPDATGVGWIFEYALVDEKTENMTWLNYALYKTGF